jgi:hypothetical protein
MGEEMTYFDDFFEELEQDEYEFDAEGENKELYVLGGYRFTERSKRKLGINRLDIGNAMLVLLQNNFDISRTSGSTIAFGECERGKAIIVIRPIIHDQAGEDACFDVITGFIVG